MADRVLNDRYRMVRHLARGGMAEVYIAEDQLLNRTVAVKVLFPELAADDAFVERFRREARAAASLNHHNIVSVYDFGQDQGSWFIVMEYVAGRTLRDIIRADGPMAPARATEIAAEVAAALAAAHEQGIVHRDVKPANVLIAADTGTVKVTDFGIARAANARQSLTMPGTVLGTATYLSPEQAQGSTVDHRTDIYSLGMVLYEMLAGRPPFTGDSPVALAYQQLNSAAPPPSTYNADVPPALDGIVLKAMAKDPGARYASADDLRSQLLTVDRAVGDPDATMAIAAPPPVVEPTLVAAPSTAVLPPVAEEPVVERGVPARPVPPEVYRRRRATVAAIVILIGLAVVVALALAGRDNNEQATVSVPDVVGRNVDDATKAITDAGLTADVSERDTSGPAGRVADQDPDPGTKRSKGSKVTLIVPKAAASSTTPGTQPATTATTRPPSTTAAPTTTQAPATTAAPTTAAPTTLAPTTSVVIPTTGLVTTSRPG